MILKKKKKRNTKYQWVSMSIMKNSCSLELSAWWRWTLFTKIAGVSICHGSGRAWKSTSIQVKKWWSIAYGKLPLFLGGGMSQSPNNLLEIIASICQGCFSEFALVRPKKFGNPTSHQIPDTSPEGHQNKPLVNGDIARHEGHAISIALDGAKQKRWIFE